LERLALVATALNQLSMVMNSADGAQNAPVPDVVGQGVEQSGHRRQRRKHGEGTDVAHAAHHSVRIERAHHEAGGITHHHLADGGGVDPQQAEAQAEQGDQK
jgi:hypothetical protein